MNLISAIASEKSHCEEETLQEDSEIKSQLSSVSCHGFLLRLTSKTVLDTTALPWKPYQ